MNNQQTQGKEKGDFCRICHECMSEKDKGIKCDACESWYHTKCLKMSDASYKLLKKENLPWVCLKCIKAQREENNLRELLSELMRNFEQEKEKYREERAMLLMMMKKMSDQMTGLEKVIEEKINEKIKVSERDILTKVIGDMEEKFENFKRRKNLIVHGIPENEDERKTNGTDYAHIKDLLNELKTNVRNYDTSRIGKRIVDGRPRPITVELNNEADKIEVQKKLVNLKYTKNKTLKKVIIRYFFQRARSKQAGKRRAEGEKAGR